MKSVCFWLATLLFLVPCLFAQQQDVQGAITYIAGDAVYISLGRNQGIKDSTIVFVTSSFDTIASLKVFATSSKSSVCNILQTTRKLALGDTVLAKVERIPSSALKQNSTAIEDTIQRSRFSYAEEKPASSKISNEGLSFKGRISYQYRTSKYTSINQILTQPGVVVNIKGKLNNSPWAFDFYGNIRTLATQTQSPFPAGGESQTRIYRVSVDYDDSTTIFSVGRMSPLYSPSLGYTDGILAAKRFGGLLLGFTGGFQPSYAQREVSTAYKKFSLFGTLQSVFGTPDVVSFAYSRTYAYSLLDREGFTISYSGSWNPSVNISAQGEFDLHDLVESELVLKPRITMLMSNVTARFSSSISGSLGCFVWRPSYPYASIRNIPDSTLDKTLRTNLTSTITFYLPYGISLNNSFSPRSSEGAFGKEFSNYSSVSIANILNKKVSFRGSYNINSAAYSKSHGHYLSLQRAFGTYFDVTIRYQRQTHDLAQYNSTLSSRTLGLDISSSLLSRLTLWASVERMFGSTTEGYSLTSELSWRL